MLVALLASQAHAASHALRGEHYGKLPALPPPLTTDAPPPPDPATAGYDQPWLSAAVKAHLHADAKRAAKRQSLAGPGGTPLGLPLVPSAGAQMPPAADPRLA